MSLPEQHTEGGRAGTAKLKLSEQLSRVPIFPVYPTGRPVLLQGEDSTGQYEIHLGGVDKLSQVDTPTGLCPSLGVDHAILLLALMSFYQERPWLENRICPSYRKLWERFSGSRTPPSDNNRKRFIKLLRDLDQCRFKVVRQGMPVTGHNLFESQTEHVFVTSDLNHRRLLGSRLTDICFHPVFLHAVVYAERLRDIQLDILRRLRSVYSRALYMWLPSRAAMNDEAKPFSIRSALLFDQLGLAGTPLKERGRLLKKDVLMKDLNGVPLLRSGMTMHIRVERGVDDYYLLAWANSAPGVVSRTDTAYNLEGPLAKAFLKSGGSPQEYKSKVRELPQLTDYETGLLKSASVENISDSVTFFRMAKALLENEGLFRETLAGAKAFKGEGGKATKSFGKRLRSSLINQIAAKTAERNRVRESVTRTAEAALPAQQFPAPEGTCNAR